MARPIEEIYNSLVSKVSSQSGSSWSSLKDSMVGKELLWFGANIESDAEVLSDAVNGVVSLARYSADQLISYAYTQDVPLDLSRPSSVKVGFRGLPGGRAVVCAPFQLCLTIGTLSFYNIEYCRTDSEVTLYQGIPMQMLSGSSMVLPFTVPGNRVTPWKLYLELQSGSFQSSYVKLGSDVLSSSVWVFAQAQSSSTSDVVSPVFPYTSYNASLSSPQAKLYKVRALWDYTTCVLFGDSNWAQPVLPSQYNYTVVWLQGTYNRFTVSSGSRLEVTTPSYTGSLPLLSSSDSTDLGFYVSSSQDGETQSLSYARNYLLSEVFKNSGIVTESQIRNFVLSFPSVQSCWLDVSPGVISIYVKPTHEGDSAFEFLTDYLYQYGVPGPKYSTSVSQPLLFTVVLHDVSSAGSSQLPRAMSLLRELYSYDNVTLSTQVSSALIQQELTLQGISGITATIRAIEELTEEVSNSLVLRSLPSEGTIVLYDASGLVLGFDSTGRFKEYVILDSGLSNALNAADVSMSGLGDYVWLGGGSVSYLVSLDDGRLLLSDSSVALPPLSASFAPYGSGLYAMWYDGVDNGTDAKLVRLYQDSSVFHSGKYSIFSHPSYVTPLSNGVGGVDFVVRPDSSFTVNGVLGVSGSGPSSDSLICSVTSTQSVTVGESTYYPSGLARYRRAGSNYYYDLTLLLSATPASYVNASAFYNGVWYMPLTDMASSEAGLMGFDIYAPDGSSIGDGSSNWSKSLSLTMLNAGVGSLEGATPLSLRVVDPSTMYALYTRGSGDSLKYYFGVVYFVISVSESSEFRYRLISEVEFDASAYPSSILSASSGLVTLGGLVNGSRLFWSGSASSITASGYSTLGAGLSSSLVLSTVGSVDYSTGTIYGLVGGGLGEYVEYEIASTLTGGATYPLLSDVVVD